MKKFLKEIMILSILFVTFMPNVNGAVKYYGKVLASDNLTVRQGPTTSSKKIGEALYNSTVELVSGSPAGTTGCSKGWYQIYFNNTTDAYVCGAYLAITSTTSGNTTATTDYEKELESLGFPATYWEYLSQLHSLHPNWTFEAIDTNLDWSVGINKLSIVGNSLIETKYDGWKSTASGSYDPVTKTFIVQEGSTWYQAAPDVIAYYMDPRNFLDEKHIFMFENLAYDASYQTTDAVQNVFNGGTLGNYAQNFVDGGAENGINPIYLASRVRQEVGTNIGGTATSGAEFIYEGKSYKGLYNVYNIGATTGTNSALKGLIWANGGVDGASTTYNRPWTSIEKSILGGAQMIASSYINKGQYTTYFQRFNSSPTSSSEPFNHAYMTNIQAVASESLTTYNTYNDFNLLNNSFKFAIPIYKNMPNSTSLPSIEFNNNDLPLISTDTIINNAGYKSDGTYISGINENILVNDLLDSLRNQGATVSTIAHGNLGTGDKITINNQTYTIILYGDLNNDAQINASDLVQLKKYILGYNNLNEVYEKAADVNKDGKISLTDLVIMKKKILQLATIEQ